MLDADRQSWVYKESWRTPFGLSVIRFEKNLYNLATNTLPTRVTCKSHCGVFVCLFVCLFTWLFTLCEYFFVNLSSRDITNAI